MAEIGGGAAHIVDIALEIRIFRHNLRFPEDGFMAPDLNDPPLMEGQGAEGAGAEAAPVADQAELNFLNGRNAAGLLVAGVVGAHIGQIVDFVHFLRSQRFLGRILHHIFFAVPLRHSLGGEGITVGVLDPEGLGVFAFIILHFVKAGKHNGGKTVVGLGGFENRPVHIGNVLNIHSRV